jgi:dipeptidyl aminopeptidase/acylaminoacyl peptidase
VMLADALRQRGVNVEELIFPDEVHDFLLWRSWRDSYSAAARFLERTLGR